MIDKQLLIDNYPKSGIRDVVVANRYLYTGSIARRQLAESAMRGEKPNYRKAFLLFDAIRDQDDFKWLALMGKILSDVESPFYNDSTAKVLLHNAQILEEINCQKATQWQEKLEKYFQENSLGVTPITAEERRSEFKKFVYQFPSRFDHAYELFNPYVDNEDDEWLKLLNSTNIDLRYEDLDDIVSKVDSNKKRFQSGEYKIGSFLKENAQFYAAQKGCEDRNYPMAFGYASLMSDEEYKKIALRGFAFCVVANEILFNEIGDLYEAAITKFEDSEKEKTFCSCDNCNATLDALERLKLVVKEPSFIKAQAIVLEVLRSQYEFSLEGKDGIDIDLCYKNARESGVEEIVRDIISIQLYVSYKHELSSAYGSNDFWMSFLQQWEAALNDLNVKDIIEETIDYGPSYNQLSENGLPVAGAYSGYFRGGSLNGVEIPEGAGILQEVKGTESGKIEFEFSKSPHSLILPEDIDILTILSFCYERHIFPSIDVPSATSLNTRFLREKRTSPEWLVNTELGRTLYTTDVWAGEMAWGIDGFETSLTQQSSVEVFEKVKQSLVDLGGLDHSSSPIINVNPKNFKRTRKIDVESNEISIQVHAVDIGIDGGYQGNSRRWKHRNSRLYNHTRKTAMLTKNFNDIAVTFPVYERLRQLMAVSYALSDLRESGFKICSQDMMKLQKRKREFEERFQLSSTSKYSVRFPIALTPKGFK